MRCGECELPFIDLEAFKNHMVEKHPDSEIAKRQSAGLEVVGMFAPDFSPILLIRNGDTPIFSCLAGDGMKLGFQMLMHGRQIYDDWLLIRVLEEQGVPEEQGLQIIRELRVKRAGDRSG